MDQNRLDFLLAQVIDQARSLSIPISNSIEPQVRINTRAKTRFGCCRFRSGRYTIEVSAALLAADESAVCRVLAHEVLHTCPGCANHAAAWQHWAALMHTRFGYSIQRTDSHRSLGLEDTRPVRYEVVCSQCGIRIPRMKRSALVRNPERYRCKCGGRLHIESPGNTKA